MSEVSGSLAASLRLRKQTQAMAEPLFAEPERSSGSVAMAEQIFICGAIVLSVIVLISDWFIVVRKRYFDFRNDYRYFR